MRRYEACNRCESLRRRQSLTHGQPGKIGGHRRGRPRDPVSHITREIQDSRDLGVASF
jgi:hypothetical protein